MRQTLLCTVYNTYAIVLTERNKAEKPYFKTILQKVFGTFCFVTPSDARAVCYWV